MHTVTLKYVKAYGLLQFATAEDKAKYVQFEDSLREDSKVEVFFSFIENDEEKTLGQLAKIHAMIRELATSTGHGFNEIKDEVKKNAGLTEFSESSVIYKSFASCSKEELSRAIQACIEIGNIVGCYLN